MLGALVAVLLQGSLDDGFAVAVSGGCGCCDDGTYPHFHFFCGETGERVMTTLPFKDNDEDNWQMLLITGGGLITVEATNKGVKVNSKNDNKEIRAVINTINKTLDWLMGK